MKILLIYNSHAAHGRAGKIRDAIVSRFKEKGVNCDIRETERPGHAIQLVATTDLNKYDGVVAAGGDGTLFECVTGYFKNEYKRKPPMGILPIGTGNAFARDMADTVPSWEEAVDIISRAKIRAVDVGQFETEGRQYYYLNILGMGFVADVVKIAHKLKWLGNLSYTLGVLHRMLFLKAVPVILRLDGKIFEKEIIFVEVSNTRYTSNFYMAPGARIDDGLFDVTVLGKMTRRKLLKAFPKVFTGEHVNLPEVEQIRAKEIFIETRAPKALTPDGELLGATPVKIQCLHKAIEVFWP